MTHEQSEQLNELAGALAKAQAIIQPVLKDKTAKIPTKAGGSYGYSYADLSSVWEAIRKPLTDNGLSVVQMPTQTEDGRLSLTTMLLHSSGQYIRSTVATRPSDVTPQAIGSAITYLRRYAIGAMVGVVTDEDDDGGRASHPPENKRSQEAPTPRLAPVDDGMVKAKLAFLAFATEQTNENIRSWADALRWWGTAYDEPQTVEEWRAAGSALRNEANSRKVKPAQPSLSAEYDDIEKAEQTRKGAVAGVTK